ncbi:F-box only protein 6 isoform X2 [Phoenix dactylifera]|nr:F-box only protein 6 isoform X2 [Phoenix dactylifera]XP_026665312.1 F-box only protein 6 isoform X2 [Phoenix dactylifera]XP_026665314.1 F-box only protein 6 isoform X2 [Phoenix dactylifera]XP_038989318.1 F-box only protein 6 isoform X2 [Phoenix dactylifera]XP_038989319.1 F-box only protein 6 isoform X2 [Phoenix dactylifera]XP_038989320.1 F-box only protein 6 isoform X2 [Phoenix dactylifera]XP_038989321.1 F-box only protein 6 isoform X2 [Phoenix dactylifera]XP_038989322.1 F-box only protei
MAEVRPAQRSCRRQNCNISLGASSSNDDSVWKGLPDHLIEAVLKRLPLAPICRFRAVCKGWNSLLTSYRFCQQLAGIPWIYVVIFQKENSGALYDPVERNWYRCIIPHLHGKDVRPLASAGSLICLYDTDNQRLCVANPLKNSVRPLPHPPCLRWPFVEVGMTLNGDNISSGYKIVSLGTGGSYVIYDSLQNNWIHRGRLPSVCLPLSFVPGSKVVSIGCKVYFLRIKPDGLISYNMDNDIWEQFFVQLPSNLSDYSLAEGEGKLLLLEATSGRTCRLQVFELQNLRWRTVSCTPANFCGEFYKSNVLMQCISNQKLIMVSLSSDILTRIYTYDVLERKWYRDILLPPGMERTKGKQKILLGAAFDSSLTASA